LLRKTACNLEGNGQSDHPAADDDHVVPRVVHRSGGSGERQHRSARRTVAAHAAIRYCTIKVTGVLWLMAPETPLTLTV
jgi:hypothetical protein